MATLIVLRHGDSAWNAKNLFAGWVDVDLTPLGEEQARGAAAQLREAGLLPDAVHTSVLTRAVRTGSLVLESLGRAWVPAAHHWRLNERHYGALQGRDRREVRARYGDEQYRLWRRSYDAAPPPAPAEEQRPIAEDPRYAGLPAALIPATESLADVSARLLPYWYDAIVPELRAGRTVLVVAHSNSVRALVAHLDRLTGEEILHLNIPTGMPLHYRLDAGMAPLTRGGRYLAPRAAAEAAQAVADQGN